MFVEHDMMFWYGQSGAARLHRAPIPEEEPLPGEAPVPDQEEPPPHPDPQGQSHAGE